MFLGLEVTNCPTLLQLTHILNQPEMSYSVCVCTVCVLLLDLLRTKHHHHTPVHWLSRSLSRKACDRVSHRWRGREGRRHGDSEVLGLRLSRPSVHLEALREGGTSVNTQPWQAEMKIQRTITWCVSCASVQITGIEMWKDVIAACLEGTSKSRKKKVEGKMCSK